MFEGTETTPIYRKVNEESTYRDPFTGHTERRATQTFMIVCDEGWRESIVCEHMYGWAADWLLGEIQHKPYAPDGRPAKGRGING